MRFVVLLLFALSPSLVAQEKAGPIRLPLRDVPAALPADRPVALPAEAWYVVESEVECLLFASPGGAIAVAKETGPLRLRGRFVGGSGAIETKRFAGPFVYVIEATKPGRDELLIVPVGAKAEGEAKRVTFLVGNVVPPVDPEPEPPIPAAGLHVLVVYEANATLPAGQAAILTGQATRSMLNDVCTTDARGLKAYRLLPVGVEFGPDELPVWKTAFARPRTATPWVVISNGRRGYEGPLPKSERDFAELVRSFAK